MAGNPKMYLYRYRKYEKWRNATLAELEEVDLMVKSGELDISSEKMCPDRVGHKKVSLSDVRVESAEYDTRILKDLNIRVFVREAAKDVRVKLELEKNKMSTRFVKRLYSSTTLTRQEVAFLFGEDVGAMKYFLKRNGIVKLPNDMLSNVNSVETLIRVMAKPIFSFLGNIEQETPQELYERYSGLGSQIFEQLKVLAEDASYDIDSIQSLKILSDSLRNNLKLEMESKRLLEAAKEREIELKEKEAEKNIPKENVIFNFSNNIDARDLFDIIKLRLEDTTLDVDDIERVMIDVTKNIQEGDVLDSQQC